MLKFKHFNVGLRKPSLITCWTLFLTLFVTFTFLILVILSLRIPKPKHLNSITHINTLRSEDKNEDDEKKRWVEIISWEPRAFLYHNFLTKEECEHLINIARPSMHKSAVIDKETGNSVDRGERTSSGAFLRRGSDRIMKNIEKRIADFTFIPAEHGEPFNVLHYEVGQKYEPHYDFFMDTFSTMYAGQRTATMLMYLSDVEEGGETVFPNAKGNFSSAPWWNELSDCGKGGLSIKPKMGNALLFWSLKPDGTLDPSSLHGACPVIKGDKWSCSKWMHVHEFKI